MSPFLIEEQLCSVQHTSIGWLCNGSAPLWEMLLPSFDMTRLVLTTEIESGGRL